MSVGPKAEPVYFPPRPATPHVVHLVSFNSLHELVPPEVSFVDLIRGGPVSPFVGTPTGITYRDGHLYICDSRKDAVHDWHLFTGKARTIGATGETVVMKPVDVAVDDRGTVFVADTERAEIVSFSPSGAARTFKAPDREAFKPVAMAVHGNTLYAADIVSHQIESFDTATGRHLGSIRGDTDGDGRLHMPIGLAVDAAGRLLVAEMLKGRVQVFESAGGASSGLRPVRRFGQAGNRYGDLGKPKDLAIGPDGVIFIADAEFARVHMFNDQGQLLMLFGGEQYAPGGTPLPFGVAVATDLPASLAKLVPPDFDAKYYLFVTNSVGDHRIGLFAVGLGW